jgi:DNA-binding LytR/AlgR family response regulator
MEKLFLAICDDDANILGVVSGAIVSAFRRNGIQAEVELFRRPKDLEFRMREREFELLFLDIDMPGMDGITFAKKLRASNSRTDIIFVSNREDKVFDALRTNPGGFIRKSRFLEDAPAVVDLWVKNRPQEERTKLVVQSRDKTITVPLDKTLYIEGSDKAQLLHVAGQAEPIQVRRSMQELEDALSEAGFLRIHKGFLVNYKFIRRLENTEAVLTNGERIPLSRRRVQEIRNQYLSLMQGGGTVIL